ncbi:MAG: aspartate-semialdehyde dehydrogenase [Fervidicoccaceae archaeon]|jgi:aspartate-semialdehyde dehydrogenase
MDKFRVAVLGATGLVGQKFVSLLSSHKMFELVYLTASERSAGKRYREAVNWILNDELSENVGEIRLYTNEELLTRRDFDIAFTALPSEEAEVVESKLLEMGKVVVSNSSNWRMDPFIPLLNPEVNADHIYLLRSQNNFKGKIMKVPNCTSAILSLSLKPLMNRFGVRKVIVTTMQALSGAGLTGVPSMFIVDNLIPYIQGEEEKVENEPRKILGSFGLKGIQPAGFEIFATTTRVPVLYGHTESVLVELRDKAESTEEIIQAFRDHSWNKIADLSLPTAPSEPIIVKKENDRPQPRLDRVYGNGMSISIGRIRLDLTGSVLRYVVLGDNIVRGAAGTGVLIAELYAELNKKGKI